MEPGSFIGVLIFALPILLLALAGYWKLFQKAGRKGWEALIPFYCSYVMLKISGRPVWWLIWLFLPLAGLIVGAGILVDFIKSYGKFTAKDRAKAILLFTCPNGASKARHDTSAHLPPSTLRKRIPGAQNYIQFGNGRRRCFLQ